MINKILLAALVMGLFGFIFSLIISYASKKFAKTVDSKVEKILKQLPGANCGACGFSGCKEFAEAVVKGEASYDGCRIGKQKVAEKIAEVIDKNP
jgi:RnfABCDGE-type electron transport complex B subunit